MSRRLPASKFKFEREMAPYTRSWLVSLGLMVKEEFSTPWGICDLVGVSFSAKRVRQRLKLGQQSAIGPASRIELLNLIPDVSIGKSISVGRLERELDETLPPEELRRELDRLVGSRFIHSTRSGCFQKSDGWVPLHERIVAIELKLNRVSDGLSQAISHLRFATDVYLGLPTDLAMRIASSKRAIEFEHSGVGVVAVSHGSCRVVVAPLRKPHLSDRILQMHCVERFWRTMIRGSSA
jgi:hypothetical protein